MKEETRETMESKPIATRSVTLLRPLTLLFSTEN